MVAFATWVTAALGVAPWSVAVSAAGTETCAKNPSIPNGNFETGSMNPWYLNVEAPATIKTVSGGYDHSKYAAQITIGNGSNFATMAQYSVETCKNTRYLVEFVYKRLYATCSCYVIVYATEGEVAGSDVQRNLTASSQPGVWVKYGIEFDSKDGLGFALRIGLGCPDNDTTASAAVLYDYIRLVNAGNLTSPAA